MYKNGKINYKLNNLIEEVSLPQKNIINPIYNHSFEYNLDGWQKSIENNVGTITAIDNCGLFGTEAIPGISNTSCVKIERTKEDAPYTQLLELRQTINMDAGTYTVSGYIYGTVEEGLGIYIDVEGASSKGTIYPVHGNEKWVKYSLQFTVAKDNTNITIKLKNESINGYALFDHIQIDKGFIDQRYNFIENSSFENGFNGWTNSGASIVDNNTSGTYEKVLNDTSVKLTSNGISSYVKQSLSGMLTGDNVVIFGGWFKGDLPNNNANESLKIILRFYVSGSYVDIVYDIDKNINDWQYLMFKYHAGTNVSLLNIEVNYNGYSNVYVDNLQMYIEDFGSTYHYNDDGNITSIINPGINNNVNFSYNSANKNDVSSVTQGSKTVSIKYSSSRWIQSTVSPNNVKTSYTYDSYGNPISIVYGDKDTPGQWFQAKTVYANYGNYIDKIEDEFGNIIDFTYNPVTGLLDNMTDAKGNTTTYQYDSLGRLLQVLQGNSNAKYYYEKDRLHEIEVNNFRYTISYDNLGRVDNIKVNNILLTQYIYETYGTYNTNILQEQIYGNNDSIKFLYDNEDRITDILFKDANVTDYITKYQFQYDALGNLAVYTDKVSGKEYYYSYDFTGRIKDVTDELGNKVSYEYNRNTGNLSKFSYDINNKTSSINYFFADNGQYDYTNIRVNSGNVIKDYNYDNSSLHRLSSITLKMGMTTILTETYEYETTVKYGNSSLRVKKLTIGERTQSYTYDKNGNIETINDSKTGLTKYHYDSKNQLIREDNPVANKTYVFGYDNNGNIDYKKEYGYTTQDVISTSLIKEIKYYYITNGWNDQLTKVDNLVEILSYDNSGNPLQINDANLTWDGRELVTYTDDTLNITFKYNSNGIRTEKTVNGVTTTYYLDGDKVIYETDGINTINYYYDIDGTLIGFNYNNTDYFYARNIFGDIIEIRDIAGNEVASYEYDAWGNLLNRTEVENNPIAKINPYRYRGYRYDKETSLYYLNSRYYNPEIGRFINADGLIGEPGAILGHNLYAYTQNNPVMKVDPSGKWPEWLEDSWEDIVKTVKDIGVTIYSSTDKAFNMVKSGSGYNTHIKLPDIKKSFDFITKNGNKFDRRLSRLRTQSLLKGAFSKANIGLTVFSEGFSNYFDNDKKLNFDFFATTAIDTGISLGSYALAAVVVSAVLPVGAPALLVGALVVAGSYGINKGVQELNERWQKNMGLDYY